MRICQFLHTSSLKTQGFGVRATTSGLDSELAKYAKMVSTYSSGRFSIPALADTLLESPQMIYEFPVSYNFGTVKDSTGHLWWALSRVVYICYDYSFYSSGVATRPGNFLSHVIFFDEFPGREIFSLMQGGSGEHLRFVPKDWMPVTDNNELAQIMQTSANPFVEEANFAPLAQPMSRAIDLFFALRKPLKGQKQIIVRLKSANVGLVSQAFSLMSKEDASKVSFRVNHQEDGCNPDTKVTFVNEFYRHEIIPEEYSVLNFMKDSHQADEVEIMWREKFEVAIAGGDWDAVEDLSRWIYSEIAEKVVSKSPEFNQLAFKYRNCKGWGETSRKMAEDGVPVELAYEYAWMFCSSARERVEEVFAKCLTQDLEHISFYRQLLRADFTEAKKLDYVGSFKDFWEDERFAEFFYWQVEEQVQNLSPSKVFEIIEKIYSLSEVNRDFTRMVFEKLNHSRIYDCCEEFLLGNWKIPSWVSEKVKTMILDFLPEDVPVKGKWQLLYEVINSSPVPSGMVVEYYELAKKLNLLDAVKKVVDHCGELRGEELMEDFVKMCREHDLADDLRLLEIVKKSCKGSPLEASLIIADVYEYEYEQISDIVTSYLKKEEKVKSFIKERYPVMYRKQQFGNFMNKLKNIGKKKDAKDN